MAQQFLALRAGAASSCLLVIKPGYGQLAGLLRSVARSTSA